MRVVFTEIPVVACAGRCVNETVVSSSYLHCEWKTKDEVEDKRFDQKLKRYISKYTVNGKLVYPEVSFFCHA